MMRHAMMRDWLCTLSFLKSSLSTSELAILTKSEAVRKEWRNEASSWQHGDTEVYQIIVQEVKHRMWDAR